eukprot:scaffold2793_cov19-Tisochrysis_lutea.AAC.1
MDKCGRLGRWVWPSLAVFKLPIGERCREDVPLTGDETASCAVIHTRRCALMYHASIGRRQRCIT